MFMASPDFRKNSPFSILREHSPLWIKRMDSRSAWCSGIFSPALACICFAVKRTPLASSVTVGTTVFSINFILSFGQFMSMGTGAQGQGFRVYRYSCFLKITDFLFTLLLLIHLYNSNHITDVDAIITAIPTS